MVEKSFLSLSTSGCVLLLLLLLFQLQDCNFFSFLMQPEDDQRVAGDKEKDEGRMKSVKVLRVYHLRLNYDLLID